MTFKIAYETLTDPKALQIRFFKIDGCIRIYNRTRMLYYILNQVLIKIKITTTIRYFFLNSAHIS